MIERVARLARQGKLQIEALEGMDGTVVWLVHLKLREDGIVLEGLHHDLNVALIQIEEK